EVGQRGGVVGGVAGELFGERVVAGASAEGLLVLGDLVLAHDGGVGGVGDVDDPGPSPRAAEAGVGEGSVDLVGGQGVVLARYRDRRVPVGAGLEAVGRYSGRAGRCLFPHRPVRRVGEQVTVQVDDRGGRAGRGHHRTGVQHEELPGLHGQEGGFAVGGGPHRMYEQVAV